MRAICTVSISLTKSLAPISLWRKNSSFPRKHSCLTPVSEIGLNLTLQTINIIFLSTWPSSPTWQDRKCLLSLFQRSGVFLDQGGNCNLHINCCSVFRGALSKNFRVGKLNWSLTRENICQSLFIPLWRTIQCLAKGSIAWVCTWVCNNVYWNPNS